MIKEYTLDTKTNPSYGELSLEGEYVCLEANQEEAMLMDSRFLYKKKGEKQDIGGKNMRGNANLLSGLYNDLKGNKYYIKIPQDPKEMFCEMLHGVLTSELKLGGY